jgi:hypothetical protein
LRNRTLFDELSLKKYEAIAFLGLLAPAIKNIAGDCVLEPARISEAVFVGRGKEELNLVLVFSICSVPMTMSNYVVFELSQRFILQEVFPGDDIDRDYAIRVEIC